MVQFLEDMKGVGKKPLNTQEQEELESLRKEKIRLQSKIQKQRKDGSGKTKQVEIGSGSEEEAHTETSDEEEAGSGDVSWTCMKRLKSFPLVEAYKSVYFLEVIAHSLIIEMARVI